MKQAAPVVAKTSAPKPVVEEIKKPEVAPKPVESVKAPVVVEQKKAAPEPVAAAAASTTDTKKKGGNLLLSF